jgi:ribosomal protein S18 acetylase RimI-like enzyme
LDAAYAVLVDSHEPLYGEAQMTSGMLANLFATGNGSVAERSGEIVGAGVVNRDLGRLWVRRSDRRWGIGAELLRALERGAPLDVLRFAAPTLEPAAAVFLARNGYRRAGEIWLMGIDLPPRLPEPEWPESVSVRTFEEHDAPTVKRLLDEAYAGEPGYVPPTFASWRRFMLGDPSYDPSVWFLAVAGDAIVATALSWKEGFVKDLAVSPSWRRRGLGRALMLQTLAEFRRRGIPRVTLKTDSTNPTNAARLYERLGMEIERTDEVFEKRLPQTGASGRTASSGA